MVQGLACAASISELRSRGVTRVRIPPRPRNDNSTRPCARVVQGLACKASYAGSIPATASKRQSSLPERFRGSPALHPSASSARGELRGFESRHGLQMSRRGSPLP
ncbi:protein of unknown function [Streptomyces murinus]